MNEFNIIGDIAGNYKTLMALLKKMPNTAEVISVGDLIDRGSRSKQVLEFFMKNGKAILGNHESMLLDYVLHKNYYEDGIWLYNGGGKTLENFTDKNGNIDIPVDIVNWLQTLPLYLQYDGLLISHAPKHPFQTVEQCCDLGKGFRYNYVDPRSDNSFLWYRGDPKYIEGTFQVFGHNSHVGLKWYELKSTKFKWAVCLDSSRKEILTGMHWPSMQIYQQEYID